MNFDRVHYKQQALSQLRRRWTTPVLMTMFIGIISSVPEVCVRPFYSSSVLFAGGLCLFATFFITGVLKIVQSYIYLGMTYTPQKITFKTFTSKIETSWELGFFSYVYFSFRLALWGFVFIIPMFIKYYAYSQMFFILVENPAITVRQSLRISAYITRGHKMDLFFLDVSFLLLILIGCLTLGIGFLWIKPYINMTLANAYRALKEDALSNHILPASLAGIYS